MPTFDNECGLSPPPVESSVNEVDSSAPLQWTSSIVLESSSNSPVSLPELLELRDVDSEELELLELKLSDSEELLELEEQLELLKLRDSEELLELEEQLELLKLRDVDSELEELLESLRLLELEELESPPAYWVSFEVGGVKLDV